MTLLIITDALLGREGEAVCTSCTLHPALAPIGKRCERLRRQWFSFPDSNPLGWYAALVGAAPATLLAARCPDIAVSARQAWVASPFHAMLGRDHVRLLPESEMPWSEDDADWLAGELNPLLAEEGMHLHACDAAMILSMDTPLDTSPAPFAAISGRLLPNRHPDGPDGGRMMRLLAEIQMHLHSRPQPTREGYPPVTGLWLWGASSLPPVMPDFLPPVDGPHDAIRALRHGHQAGVVVCESADIDAVLPAAGLPAQLVLAGAGHAVLLSRSLFPSLARQWKPGKRGEREALLKQLRGLVHAA